MKHILVIGASRGLGKALVAHLRDMYDGGEAHIWAVTREDLDVREYEEWREYASLSGTSDLYGIINCAGIGPAKHLMVETEAGWDDVMDTNLTANFHMIRTMAHLLRDGGSFITLSSVIGMRAGPAAAVAYEVSKAAQLALVRHAACRLAPRVRVNALVPGYIADTGMTDAIKGEKFDAYIKRTVPLARMAHTEEIAHAAKFLLDNTYVTGTSLVVDGGWLAR